MDKKFNYSKIFKAINNGLVGRREIPTCAKCRFPAEVIMTRQGRKVTLCYSCSQELLEVAKEQGVDREIIIQRLKK